MPSPLNNVIWSALTTHQAPLAIGGELARRFSPVYTPFAACADFTPAHFDALAQLVLAGEEVALFTLEDLPPAAAFEVTLNRGMLQMVAPTLASAVSPARPELFSLGPDDNADMQALAEETKPGPFSTRTRELGQFFGIRVGSRLVAMAGERLHLTGFREITAVCVLPAFRGCGYARDLVLAVAQGIQARGETPMLHVYNDNHSAVALYQKLGFTTRVETRVTRLRRL